MKHTSRDAIMMSRRDKLAGKSTENTGICAVPNCSNVYYPGCRIRFHFFPKDIQARKKWFESLKLSRKDYREGARICQLHFDRADYYNYKRGYLKDNAVPSVNEERIYNTSESDDGSIDMSKVFENLSGKSSNGSDSDDDFAITNSTASDKGAVKKVVLEKVQKSAKAENINKTVKKVKKETIEDEGDFLQDFQTIKLEGIDDDIVTKVCRTCLATDCKMYSMKQYNLEQTYLLLTGMKADMLDDYKMPQVMCFECVKKLQNFIEFSAKSLTSWTFLMELIEENKLTINDIKRIDRTQNLLGSKLNITHYDNNYFDLKVEECDFDEDITFKHENNENINQPNEIVIKEVKDTNEEMEIEIDIKNIITEDLVKEETNYEVTISNVEFKNDESTDEEITFQHDRSDDDNDCRKRNREFNRKEFNELFVVKNMTPKDQMQEMLKRKSSDVYIKSKFKCDKCYRGFQVEKAFIDHMRKHTDACGEFVCDICQVHFPKRSVLAKHVSSTHSKFISCRLCPFGTVFVSTAIGHKNHHDGYRFSCNICQKDYSKHTSYLQHRRRRHAAAAACHVCGASLALLRDLDRHFRTTHREDNLFLLPSTETSLFGPVKRKKVSSECVAVSYVTTLPKHSPTCFQCDIKFRDMTALRVHLTQSPNHKEVTSRTKEVSRTTSKRNVNKEMDPYVCEQCNEELPNYQSYYIHFTIHHPDKNRTQYNRNHLQCMCEICGKVYQNLTRLNDHRLSHGDARLYSCNTCGKTFKEKTTLYLHTLNHRHIWKCAVCDKEFSTIGNLNRHKRLHTHKPYKCEPCNKRFETPSAKQTHIRHTHLGVPWPKKRPKGAPAVRRKQIPHSANTEL